MKKWSVKIFGITASGILFCLLSIGHAGAYDRSAKGPFFNVLFDNFCQGLPSNQESGCYGYLQYRIERGNSRDRSLDLCTWGCGEIMERPSTIQDCHKGCRDTHAQDN